MRAEGRSIGSDQSNHVNEALGLEHGGERNADAPALISASGLTLTLTLILASCTGYSYAMGVAARGASVR